MKPASGRQWNTGSRRGKASRIVAAELGVNTQSLLQWKQRFGPLRAARIEVRTLEAVETENRRLRPAVESLVRQREPSGAR